MINGIQKLTLLDFPEHVACTVFLAGCDLRCPFCHNASLVTGAPEAVMSEEKFFSFLEKRHGILDGVAITGGEPLLRHDIKEFAMKIKEHGFAVKLDTNGTNPDALDDIIGAGAVDYVAMDIKNSPAKYAATTGRPDIDLEAVRCSVGILMSGRVGYEFRTTVVGELHTVDDIREIGKLIAGAERYFLQQFRDSGEILGGKFTPPTKEEMQKMADAVREYVPSVALRGV